MSYPEKLTLFILRVTMGWMFLYAGVTKLIDPSWSAAGYLNGAKSAVWLYQFFLQPSILPTVNFLNEWGLTLLGVSLLVGLCVRLSSTLGIGLMFLYYLAVLNFPYVVDQHSFLVDQHIVYIAALAALAAFRAGRAWGLEPWCATLPLCKRFPKLRSWLG